MSWNLDNLNYNANKFADDLFQNFIFIKKINIDDINNS